MKRFDGRPIGDIGWTGMALAPAGGSGTSQYCLQGGVVGIKISTSGASVAAGSTPTAIAAAGTIPAALRPSGAPAYIQGNGTGNTEVVVVINTDGSLAAYLPIPDATDRSTIRANGTYIPG